MPIAPYSPGILSGGAPFAPVPPMPAPAKNAPATSSLAVNANGSLVSFLPPVNDWYSPAMQTAAAPTTTPPAHPCQSGGDCGCGGKCKKGVSQIQKPPANNAAPGTYLSYKFPTGKSGVTKELRLSLPTFSRIEMSLDMPGQSEPVTAALNLTPGVGWKYDTGGKTAAFGAIVVLPIIPESATPSDIATGFWIGNMIVSKSIDTLQKVASSASVAPSVTTSVPPTVQSSCTPEPKNISADENLICDYFAHQTLSIQYPCGNFITLDVQSCCIQHDINLWCGPPNIITDTGELLAWLAGVETELASCVAGMILGTIGDSGVSWWCGGYITAAIYAAVAAALVFTLWYSLTYAFQLGQIANDIFTTGGSSAFPLDGRNKDSCLCGGTTPTYATGVAGLGTYYDFCAQRGLKEDCYK